MKICSQPSVSTEPTSNSPDNEKRHTGTVAPNRGLGGPEPRIPLGQFSRLDVSPLALIGRRIERPQPTDPAVKTVRSRS